MDPIFFQRRGKLMEYYYMDARSHGCVDLRRESALVPGVTVLVAGYTKRGGRMLRMADHGVGEKNESDRAARDAIEVFLGVPPLRIHERIADTHRGALVRVHNEGRRRWERDVFHVDAAMKIRNRALELAHDAARARAYELGERSLRAFEYGNYHKAKWLAEATVFLERYWNADAPAWTQFSRMMSGACAHARVERRAYLRDGGE